MSLTIGFFGDSYCCQKYGRLLFFEKYKTYIKKLEDYYSAKIVSLGRGTTGVQDLLLNQLTPYIEKNSYPDICIFTWTNPGRLFHRTVRNITHTVVDSKATDDLHTAARMYYKHIYDRELIELEYVALMQYIDLNILSKFPKTTKIIHLWSFGKFEAWDDESFKPENLKYHYRWTTGVEIRPALVCVSLLDANLSKLHSDRRPNHIAGEVKNSLVFDNIKSAIDEFEDCKLITYNI